MIKKFDSYNSDVGNVLDCFLDLEDDGFEIKLESDIIIDVFPQGHFLYNPVVWSKAIEQWHTPWTKETPWSINNIPSMYRGVISKFHSDLIRIRIISHQSKISTIDFYYNAINVRKNPILTDVGAFQEINNTESYQYLDMIRKNPLMKRIYNLTGFYLYNCYYSDLNYGKMGSIVLEFMKT